MYAEEPRGCSGLPHSRKMVFTPSSSVTRMNVHRILRLGYDPMLAGVPCSRRWNSCCNGTVERWNFSDPSRSGAIGRAGEESPHFADKNVKGRLIAQQYVIGALEIDELRTGYSGRQGLALLEGNRGIVPGMKHESGYANLTENVRDIHVAECLMKPAGTDRRGRLSLKIVEPGHLLAAGSGNERLREQLSESRIVLAPSFPDQSCHRLVGVDFIPAVALAPALGIAAVEHKMRKPLRMADGIGDRNRTALRNAEECENVKADRIGDTFSRSATIASSDMSGNSNPRGHCRVRRSGPAYSRRRGRLSSVARPGSPTRTEDATSSGRRERRRPLTRHCKSNPGAIGAVAVADISPVRPTVPAPRTGFPARESQPTPAPPEALPSQ